MLAKILSLISIVTLLGWMFYFLVGGSPLLILKHDEPSDSRLVRGFFDVHYMALMSLAAIGALSSAFADRRILAAAFAGIAFAGFTARRMIISRMDHLRGTMTATDTPAIRRFRNLHITGLVLDLFLMAGFISALALSTTDIVKCSESPAGCRGDGCRVLCSLL